MATGAAYLRDHDVRHRGSVMDSNSHSKKTAMGNLFSNVVGKMLHVQPVVEKRELNLAQKMVNIRAVSVRKGFQSILARGDEMTQRLNHYRRQHEAMIAKRDGNDTAPVDENTPETIVLTSSS
jgi:hypothetical protein